MPELLGTPLLFLAAEIGERYLGRLLVDVVAVHAARKNLSEIDNWLQRQSMNRNRMPSLGTDRRPIKG
jgi:hypothetical protein